MIQSIPQMVQAILAQGGKVYDATGHWLYVKQTGGGLFTVYTRNNCVWLKAYLEIDYATTFAEAQAALDAFALRNNLPVLYQ